MKIFRPTIGQYFSEITTILQNNEHIFRNEQKLEKYVEKEDKIRTKIYTQTLELRHC